MCIAIVDFLQKMHHEADNSSIEKVRLNCLVDSGCCGMPVQASALLQRTLEAADEHGTFSSSRSDLLKNTVLAKIRLLQALQAEAVSNPLSNKKSSSVDSISYMERRYAEIMLAREHCLTLIPRFLLEAIDDKDAEAFGKVYVKLRETSHV